MFDFSLIQNIMVCGIPSCTKSRIDYLYRQNVGPIYCLNIKSDRHLYIRQNCQSDFMYIQKKIGPTFCIGKTANPLLYIYKQKNQSDFLFKNKIGPIFV